jgi:hypothetical protein
MMQSGANPSPKANFRFLCKVRRFHPMGDAAGLPPPTLPADWPHGNETDHYLITHPLMQRFSM